MTLAMVGDRLQVWGGVECTINRVGNNYFDQLTRTKHDRRLDDLDRFAELGIPVVRYPILWERLTEPTSSHAETLDQEELFWRWAEERLRRLDALGIVPIVGLVHHGSGPRDTTLTSADFPGRLAAFAQSVAEHYPWVDYYSPVNEPLTTARFSALYGHWYPHAHDDRMFARALVHQCQGMLLSMQSIRKVNPTAKLIFTEDLCKVHSTPRLAYQADFENERRWLTCDLILGRLRPGDRMWRYLTDAGIDAYTLHWFIENSCVPEVIGWNYYLTSERLLDERTELYPSHRIGGNGRHHYADVEAVRARGEGIDGLASLLNEAWQRYHLPMAVTEVHLGDHRESQLRWLVDAWLAALKVRIDGIDLRAITSWALLGSYDWASLVTRHDGLYESGAFDVRSGTPRITAVGTAIRSLAQGAVPIHPAMPEQGWWERPCRLNCEPVYSAKKVAVVKPRSFVQRSPVLITGARGMLGNCFTRACEARDVTHVPLSRTDLDISDLASIEEALDQYAPWAVVNGAGYAAVDEAEDHADDCHQTNTTGPANLAIACAARGIQLLTFSTDLVFDGSLSLPYVEGSQVAPLSVYGLSKVAAEQQVLSRCPEALVIRTSVLFGPWDEHNFLTASIRQLLRGERVNVADDWIVSPTYAPDLVHACLDLLVDGESGIWHLANIGSTSWADFLCEAAARANVNAQLIDRCPTLDMQFRARRPAFSALGSERGLILPKLEQGIAQYCDSSSAMWEMANVHLPV